MSRIRPSYYGVFEDNDPSKRLMVVANFDNDVPEYWEWSGEGLFPFDSSNEAYKLGVNYMDLRRDPLDFNQPKVRRARRSDINKKPYHEDTKSTKSTKNLFGKEFVSFVPSW